MHAMNKIVRLLPNGGYELGLDFFRHHAEGIEMIWDGVEPKVGTIFTDAMSDLLGPPRAKGEEINQHHKDIAASVQNMYEQAFFDLLNVVQRSTGETAVCIAGGCAMNSVANGKIFERTNFRDLYVQAAAGDAGGAIGAANIVWIEVLGEPRGDVMEHAYLGPSFSNESVAARSKRNWMGVAGCAIQLKGLSR
jgi:carbamoyltransferase